MILLVELTMVTSGLPGMLPSEVKDFEREKPSADWEFEGEALILHIKKGFWCPLFVARGPLIS